MYRKPLSINRILEYQKQLDESDKRSYEEYALNFRHFAFTELMNQRKQNKGFVGTFSGVALVVILMLLAFITTLDLSSIGIICISSLILMCYGIIKLSEKKYFAFVLLLSIFILATFANYVFSGLVLGSSYTYYYLCGLIVLLGSMTFFKKIKK